MPARPSIPRLHASLVFSLFLAITLLPIAPSSAQSPTDEEQTSALEPADTSSPRATLNSFIDACNEIYELIQLEEAGDIKRDEVEHHRLADKIFHCMDLTQEAGFLKKYAAGEAAVSLKEVLDRIPLPPQNEIPGLDEVTAAEADGQTITKWRIPRTEIVIARVPDGPDEGDYVFSADSVARAADFFRRIKDSPYLRKDSVQFYEWFLSDPGPRVAPLVRALPDSMRTSMIGRHAMWQWIGLVVSFIVAIALMALAYLAGGRRGERFRQSNSIFRYCLTLSLPIAAMLVPLLLGRFVRDQLRISGNLLAGITFTTSVIFLLSAMFVIVAVGSRVAAIIISSPRINPKGLDAQLVRIVCRTISLIAAIFVFLEGGKYLGIPLTTLLASAGVGGLALALAAQDSLKNFFGSIMIILDKPFRIGDRIVINQHDGIVEEIGLRSTKLRLLNGHQVSIPNEELARSQIENIGRRPHIRRVSDLRIPLDTPPDTAARAVEIVEEILKDHEGFDPEKPPRVSLNEFNADSLNIRMFYWYHPPDYWKFLAHSQAVNLEIKTAFEKEGIHFAPPTSVTEINTGTTPTDPLATGGLPPSADSPATR
ncbi:MAG: mechanosensitive ion channel family protein [Verrucomicrobiota bacterium]